MTNVIAVTGRKGGIGKSTIAGNLAGELASAGLKVRVLDTDPQKSLFNWARLGEGILRNITGIVETIKPEEFKKLLLKVRETADVVIIDTPPAFSDHALLAALLADIVLLPAGPSPLDIMAARDALDLVKEVQRHGNRKPKVRFIPSKTINRATLSIDLPITLEALGAPVLPGVAQRTCIAEAALSGLTVIEYAKTSIARQEFLALTTRIMEMMNE